MRISDWSSDVCSSDLRRDPDLRRADRLHILHRMNGRVDVATQKRRIQLLGPQRLAADLGERPVLHAVAGGGKGDKRDRSEEHTSELQSLMRISYAAFCLKKKTHNKIRKHIMTLNFAYSHN